MSAFAVGLLETRARRLALWLAAAVVLTAAAGALVSYAPTQPQLVKAGLLSLAVTALLLLAMRLPVSVLPLAVVVGLLGLGNMELSRIVPLPVLGGQEKWVLIILAGVAVLGAALDASAPSRPAWPAALLLGALFLGICSASLVYALDRSLAVKALEHQVVQMVALAAGFFWIRRVREARALVVCLAVVGAVSAALGVWQFLSPETFSGAFERFTGVSSGASVDLWGHDLQRIGALWLYPGQYGALLSASVPAFLCLWLRQRHSIWTWVLGAAFGLTLVALALNGTRITLVGAALAVPVFLLAWGVRPKMLSRIRSGILPALAGALVVAVLLSARGPSGGNALGRLFDLFGEEGRTSVSVTNRLLIYGTLAESWQSNPVLGVGLGNTRSTIEELTTYNTSPHSYWLGLLAETGLIGTGLVVLMLASVALRYRRILDEPAGSAARQFAAFALALSVALLTFGLVHGAMFTEWQTGALFWLMQGAVLSLSLRHEDDPDVTIDGTGRSGAEAARAG
jgi:hypothetical protein